MSTPRRILSPAEIEEVIDALERLACIYEALGFPEDGIKHRRLAEGLRIPAEKE